MVFGAGTHPTTRDCLKALALAWQQGPENRLLDLGTGTGVLALAAAKLGFRNVLAVDFNYLAVQTARDNIRRNGLERQVLAVQGRGEQFTATPGDFVTANIHYDVMVKILSAPDFRFPKRFILSGLMRSEAREIRRRLDQMDARLYRTWERDGIWHTFYGEIP